MVLGIYHNTVYFSLLPKIQYYFQLVMVFQMAISNWGHFVGCLDRHRLWYSMLMIFLLHVKKLHCHAVQIMINHVRQSHSPIKSEPMEAGEERGA